MNKRGQFYIIAAIAISIAVISIASVTTYVVVKSSPRTIYDISEDLEKEGAKIIDYGLYTDQNLTEVLDDFTDEEFISYFSQKAGDVEIIFVYGNKTDLYATQYSKISSGSVAGVIDGGTTGHGYEINRIFRKRIEECVRVKAETGEGNGNGYVEECSGTPIKDECSDYDHYSKIKCEKNDGHGVGCEWDSHKKFCEGEEEIKCSNFEDGVGCLAEPGCDWIVVNVNGNGGEIVEDCEGQVILEVLGRDYYFNLKEGEMFYFLIVQKRGEEVYVERN